MKTFSIILVTYNSKETIGHCLNSILEQALEDCEVIVIDNASYDNTAETIQKRFPSVTLTRNEKNLGFAEALNQGIRKSKGAYILVLNSDIILGRNFIKKLKQQLTQLPDNIGMLSPKIIGSNGLIDSTGLYLSFLRRFYDKARGCKDDIRENENLNIFGPCAACAIYKREMLEHIKAGEEYFDGDFFLIGEDFDIAWRANLSGWKGVFIPEIVCFHQGGISRGKTKVSQYYAFRNRYLLLIKNESLKGLFLRLPFIWIYDLPRFIYMLFTNRHTLRALIEIKQLFPKMIKKRGFIKDKVK